MTELQRLAGIVIAPQETFDDINRRPSVLLPLILLLLFNLAVNFIVYRVIVTDANFEQIARAEIAWHAAATGEHESPAIVEQQIEALRAQRNRWYVLPLIALPSSLVGLSVVLFLALLLARAGAAFPKVFIVVCWSLVIYRCIGGIFTILTLLIRGPANFFPGAPEAWSPTSLAHAVSRTAVSPSVYSTISKLDVFLIWWLAVLAIGLAKISKNLTIGRSMLLIAVVEVLYLLANAAGWLAGAF